MGSVSKVYFTRDITNQNGTQEKWIFDPMIRNGATGNKQSYATGWDKEDDLKVVSADITVTAQFKATGIWGPIIWF